MNKRIEKKLTKNVKEKRQRQRLTGARVPLTRPERKLARRHKNVTLQTIGDALKDCLAITGDITLSYEATKEVIEFMTEEETWEERINRIDSYKFANPMPIKVHRSPTLWDRLKDKLKGWLRG